MGFDLDVVVVGGAGHVGLPLAIAFADRGLQVGVYDLNPASVQKVKSGVMPFDEPGAEEVLERVNSEGRLTPTTEPSVVSRAEHIVVVIGTPVDEHLNPDPQAVPSAVEALAPHLRRGQLLVLRSTVYPGVTALVERPSRQPGPGAGRVVLPRAHRRRQGSRRAVRAPSDRLGAEPDRLCESPQALRGAGHEMVELLPEEAELAKLFTNAYRYLKFALANQLYMMANDFGLDYERIRQGVIHNYPRAADLPAAGFAAGPCLLKDTMQLAAFNNNNFVLGHAAMMVNEGLPLYLVDRLSPAL